MSPRESIWNRHCDEIIQFMRRNHCRPSKHRPEEHAMVNWIKFNKRQLARGKMPASRVPRFRELLKEAEAVQRVNQYAYVPLDKLTLF